MWILHPDDHKKKVINNDLNNGPNRHNKKHRAGLP